jgi:hypothetical protein
MQTSSTQDRVIEHEHQQQEVFLQPRRITIINFTTSVKTKIVTYQQQQS